MGIEIPNKTNLKVGDTLKLSIKPEDISISNKHAQHPARGGVISIIPQVGSFKITIDFEGIQIIALTYDETLVAKLRENGERVVSFSFNPDSIVILDS